MEPLTSPEVRALAASAGCNLSRKEKHLADCVVRAIAAGKLTAPSPCVIIAGIGTLTAYPDGTHDFAPAGLRLGDAVHAVAHPVARAIDAVAGTSLTNCQACAERRRRWNGGGA